MREIPDLQFHIAGRGPQRKELEIAARRQAVHDRVVFLEEAADIGAFFTGLDFCVVPLRRGGIDRLTLEAWSCSTLLWTVVAILALMLVVWRGRRI